MFHIPVKNAMIKEPAIMIPFLPLEKINSVYQEPILECIRRIIESGEYILGYELAAFEQEFAELTGVKHVIGVGNGLEALVIALKVLDIGPGDEVIVPANTYIASILGISGVGAAPILIDADWETGCINTDLIPSKITRKTRAILPVHIYGFSCNMDAVLEIAKRHQLRVVEDCAQSHLTQYGENNVGSLGDIGAYSFFPTKNLGALGDAGAIAIHDDDLAQKARSYRNYGIEGFCQHKVRGMNSRLDEVQACILRIKLHSLQRDNEKRRSNASYYLSNIHNPFMELPCFADSSQSAWNYFPVHCTQRERLQNHLWSHGIESLAHYCIPPHKQKAYRELNHLSFPVTERIHRETLFLPINQTLSEADVQYITEICNAYQQ